MVFRIFVYVPDAAPLARSFVNYSQTKQKTKDDLNSKSLFLVLFFIVYY